MEINDERKETYYKYNIDATDEEAALLKEIGLKRIQTDDAALINYAVVKMLEDYIQELAQKEKSKDGTQNKRKRKDVPSTSKQN